MCVASLSVGEKATLDAPCCVKKPRPLVPWQRAGAAQRATGGRHQQQPNENEFAARVGEVDRVVADVDIGVLRLGQQGQALERVLGLGTSYGTCLS